MKLKTLKEIGRDMRMTSAIPGFARDELRDEIKQEAIWHINHLREEIRNATTNGNSIIVKRNLVQIAWIKNFFNIEESDLE